LFVKAGYVDQMLAQEPAFEAPPVDGLHNPVQQFGKCRNYSLYLLVVWIIQDGVIKVTRQVARAIVSIFRLISNSSGER
jgi:hypothetical protein